MFPSRSLGTRWDEVFEIDSPVWEDVPKQELGNKVGNNGV
jgi:hypothetical protein